MRSTVASLAVALALALSACGGDDAEPGAPQGGASTRASSEPAKLILDFQPNAVHAGLYAAIAGAADRHRGLPLEIIEPGDSSDAPKLLRAGRVDFAVLDIHDLAIAREQGFDLVGIAAIVQRPLAAVIAADRAEVREPADLESTSVGVTGLPSDDAVLESVLEAGGADPASVDRRTIGFDSIAALGAGRVAAATAFWNVEGVALRELGIPTREFRVDDFGAPPYPELIVCATRETIETRPGDIEALRDIVREGYEAISDDPKAATRIMLDAEPAQDPRSLRLQLRALGDALRPAPLDRRILERWATWDLEHGIVSEPIEIAEAFELPPG